jgi:hypothetical protein
MSHSEPLSPKSLAPRSHPPEDEDEEMADVEEDAEDDEEEIPNQEGQNAQPNSSPQQETRPSRETRKDRDLNDFLNDMDKYAPIVYPHSILNALIARSPMP